ncbi:hypothetical protein ACU686_40220 [Yinghuangia aomiensis]
MGITQPLHREAQQNPDKVAVRQKADTTVTFREFRDRTAWPQVCCAGWAPGRGDRVAILSLNSVRYLELLVGTGLDGRCRQPGQHPVEPSPRSPIRSTTPGRNCFSWTTPSRRWCRSCAS